MQSMDFKMPVNLITGRNCVRHNAASMLLGKKAVIVSDKVSARASGALDDVVAVLDEHGVEHVLFDEVQPNPLLSACETIGSLARAQHADFVIGIGGGSALDSAKAAAVFAANDMPGEEVFRGTWSNRALPIVLIGTTAGTGSEITRYANVTVDRTGLKKVIYSDETYATVAFGDPKYTDSLPLQVTLPTTLDAFCHAVEGYFSTRSNPVSDMFALAAIKMLMPAYRQLHAFTATEQISPAMRDDLYFASLLAGFVLNQASTCFGHAVAYFLSENYHIPHGYACIAFLPACIVKAEAHIPQKVQHMYAEAQTSKEEILALTAAMSRFSLPAMTLEEVDAVVTRWDTQIPANFARTPGGYTKEEVKDLFVTKFVTR